MSRSPHYQVEGEKRPLKYRKRTLIQAGTVQMYVRREVPHSLAFEMRSVMAGTVQMFFWTRRDDTV